MMGFYDQKILLGEACSYPISKKTEKVRKLHKKQMNNPFNQDCSHIYISSIRLQPKADISIHLRLFYSRAKA